MINGVNSAFPKVIALSTRLPAYCDFAPYWHRGEGLALKFWKPLSYEQLPHWEQWLCQCLRTESSSEAGFDTRLNQQDEEFLLARIEQERLAGYISAQLQKTRFVSLRNCVSDDFRARLRRMSAEESGYLDAYVQRFGRLYETVKNVQGKILVLKGPALATLVYPIPEMRVSGDIDLLVSSEALMETEAALLAAGYFSDLEARIQTGAAPASTMAEVCLQPGDLFVCCDGLVFRSEFGEFVELKIDPLDRGLKMPGLSKVFENAITVDVFGLSVNCPNLEDQLLIACCNLQKDLFNDTRRMLDIHLIVEQLNRQHYAWEKLVDRARREFLEPSVWIALAVTCDRLATKLDEKSMNDLRPKGLRGRWLTYTLNYIYIWNYNSLPMLLAQTFFSSERARRQKALVDAMFPSRQFLSAYYFSGQENDGIFQYFFAILLHWFVLLMPSAIIKRTVGLFLWREKRKKF